MTANRMILLLAIILLCSPLASTEVYGQESGGTLVGPGVENILTDGEEDESGLIFNIQIPNRSNELWVVTVYNPTNEPVSAVRRTLEIEQDGQWYLLNMDAQLRFSPYVIEPGGFGFDSAGNLGGNPSEFDDVRLSPTETDNPRDEKYGIADIEIEDLSSNTEGGYSGLVVNTSEHTLSNVGVNFACVDEDGFFTDAWLIGVDINRLPSGDEEPFEFSDSNGSCTEGSDVIATAAGNYDLD